jgi:predicted DNA-binding transcriptional regulator YafY
MSGVEALSETFPRPAKFDLAAWWARSSREYEVSTYRESATIRLSPRGRALVGMLGPYVAEAVAKTAAAPDEHGWIRCTIPLESGDLGIRELLRLGADVEVVSPATVRANVTRALHETLQYYAPPRDIRDATRQRRRCSA